MESKQLALKVQEALIKKGETLACAESCTGGYLSYIFTSNPGASSYFLGSFIPYSNALKEKVLGVRKETLEAHGAVSKQTVEEMLYGVLSKAESDFAVAISGVAGPDGGTDIHPIGTVWIGVIEKGKLPYTKCFHFQGNRNEVILQSTKQACIFLLDVIINNS